ncbi:phospholipid phosphatase 2 isoform X2 [Amyelois transitella]|uniref:phospholipid phosphatase 2 isoform X2 n=1 Tax=Amyelois transitella TaxID=680683 RepID=UPI00298F6578|nr:phospholipid phosphatase 2 isoform X2 [Amyelois transitella]
MVQQNNAMRTSIEGLKRMASISIQNNRRDLESQHLKTDSRPRHSFWWTLIIDLPLFIIVLTLIGLFELNVIPSYKAGFFCRDPALDYAFTGDTVTMKDLCFTILLLPIPLLWITEWIFSDEDMLGLRAKQASFHCLRLLRVYLYGFFFNLCLVEAMKGIAGSPRPTFNAICRPDVWDTCKDSEYVTSFKCTSNFSVWFQNDASHSFPSGHTSLSVYCAVFLAWYLQRRAFCWSHRTLLLVPFMQLVLLSLATLTSLTRITDHRHHWWDVLFGLGVGLATAYYAIAVLCDNFSRSSIYSNEPMRDHSKSPARTLIFEGRREDTTP